MNEDIKRLLIRFYKNCKNNELSDSRREKRLKRIRSDISQYSKFDIQQTAKALSKSKGHPYIFKVWCDIVVLTGEV